MAAIEEARLWTLTPGSSLNVWMVRGLLLMMVLVVLTYWVLELGEAASFFIDMSRMWTTSGSHDTWDTPAIHCHMARLASVHHDL